ncbi:HD-domain/PDEase-like protein [Polychaeton citri CBS 116435]|uniref:Phosphodiesterase n=1 Tax=Polychaeton citri CBS 116435 TaxID=1314669 RepID=A0A9P4Q7F0_9PEZI|nr:HD-domain/PDEase-like protein [Polychaeton citri CBS 116435]
MTFAVIVPSSTVDSLPIDANTATKCLHAGALEVVSSPFGSADINRIVSHFKEQTRAPARLLGSAMAQNLVDSIRDTHQPMEPCHRPDQTVLLDRRKLIEESIDEWKFCASEYDWDELVCAVVFMLERLLGHAELAEYGLVRAELVSFVLATRRQYKHERQVHYHNWRHAVDVTQSLYCFLLAIDVIPSCSSDVARQHTPVEKLLTPLDGLILLISAIGHDVGHPGVNNAFLVACNHPLAQLYNDKSVLENYHCAAYSQLLRRHWPALGDIAGFRATMISTILATDMGRHFEYMGNLGDLKQRVHDCDSNVDDWSEKDQEHVRELLMALLMKAADISNVARPFNVSSGWAKILLSEFARQGELEAELDIPTCLFGGPPKQDDELAAAQSQQGFINLFGCPLFGGIAEVLPSMKYTVDILNDNMQTWSTRIDEEKRRREKEAEDGALTLASVSREDLEEAKEQGKVKHHASEPSAVLIHPAQPPRTPVERELPERPDGSPDSHPASELRQRLVQSFGTTEDKRSHAHLLHSPSKSPFGPGSRRSSKDAALDSIHPYSIFAHQNFNAGSRRGSNASAHFHQNYSTSRRGSKDESLTTILVTSGASNSPARRSSPNSSSGTKVETTSSNKVASTSNNQHHHNHNQTMPGERRSQKQSIVSVPSSRSHATSSATAATSEPSPSTQASSLAPTLSIDDEPTPPAQRENVAATEDPFLVPESWPNAPDTGHRHSAPNALPATPPPRSAGGSSSKLSKTDSPQIVASMASGESEEAHHSTPRKTNEAGGIRESRSRSKLRGLKFWKKKKDHSGMEGGEASSV